MTLLPNEVQIPSVYDDVIILTNQRIQKKAKNIDSAYSVSMYLEDISTVEHRFKNNILLLVLGILTLLVSLMLYTQKITDDESIISVVFVLGIVIIILWLVSRKNTIEISSNGGSSLSIILSNSKKSQAESFVDQVLLVKGQRIMQLYKL